VKEDIRPFDVELRKQYWLILRSRAARAANSLLLFQIITSIFLHTAAVSSINTVTTALWCIRSLYVKLGPNSIQQVVCNIFCQVLAVAGRHIETGPCGRKVFCVSLICEATLKPLHRDHEAPRMRMC
jgi:hypothetical protein